MDIGDNLFKVGDTGSPGTFVWQDGTLKGTLQLGSTTVTGTTSTIKDAATKTLDGGIINNYGTMTWTTGSGDGTIDMKNTSILNNYNTFAIQNIGNASITQSVGVGTINNFSGATFTKNAGAATTTTINTRFKNQGGTLEADAGTMSFDLNAVQSSGATNLNGGTIQLTGLSTLIIDGGTLSGVGTVDGPVKLDTTGVLTPGLNGAPGRLNVTGDFEMDAGTTLNINVTNSAIALLHVEGKVTLNTGTTLNVFPASGYSATSGTLTFMDGYTSISGDFTYNNLTNPWYVPGSGYYWLYGTKGSSSYTLTITPYT